MSRNGFSQLLLSVFVLVASVIAVVFIIYLGIWKNSSGSGSQGSGMPDLINFMKQNGMQAAVVETLDQSDVSSVWLVKQDGEKFLVATLDVGAYANKYPTINGHAYDVMHRFSLGDVALLPDNARVYSIISDQSYDISKYLDGYAPSAQWSDPIVQRDIAVVRTDGQGIYTDISLSPDGKHSLGTNYSYGNGYLYALENTIVSPTNGIMNITIGARTSLDSFKAWSIDGVYILGGMNNVPGEYVYPSSTKLGQYIYNINTGDLTPVDAMSSAFMNHNFPDIQPFSQETMHLVGLIPAIGS